MDEFLKMDVFFVVTTIAVFVLSVLGSIALVVGIRILQRFEQIMILAEEETHRIYEDLERLRAKTKSEGLKLRHIVGFLSDLKKPRVRTTRNSHTHGDTKEKGE